VELILAIILMALLVGNTIFCIMGLGYTIENDERCYPDHYDWCYLQREEFIADFIVGLIVGFCGIPAAIVNVMK
jgi:hypothetical protein